MSDLPLRRRRAAEIFCIARDTLRRRAFPRFLAVGVINTLFGYAIFVAIWLASGSSLLALFIATIMGVAFNFFSIGGIVFRSTELRFALPFVGVYALLFGVNAAALWLLELSGVNAALAQAILTLPIAALSFALNRRYVFGGRDA